jgi:hypothetical protein
MKRAVLVLGVLLLVPVSGWGAPSLSNAYNEMTRAEKWLTLRYFWQAPAVYRAGTYARDESASRYPQQSGQDDQRDAYRHSLWNGSMTRRLKSEHSAERWGNAHEEFPGNPAARKAMDLSNNQTGRQVTWTARASSGPWWWRRTTFPDDAATGNTLRTMLGNGQLVMVEEVGGSRDPDNGRLVPTTTP